MRGLRQIVRMSSEPEIPHSDENRAMMLVGMESMDSREEPSGHQPWHASYDLEKLPYCPVYFVETVTEKHAGGKTHKLFRAHITSTIETIEEYFTLLEVLYSMGEDDIIEILIDSPGGYINTGATIATAIRSCKGRVITHAVGLCASSGSLIWSAGHECVCSSMATFMWHMSSHGSYGNSITVQRDAEAQVDFVRKVFLDISFKKGHITREEVDRICSVPDEAVWITAEEMNRRLAAAA